MDKNNKQYQLQIQIALLFIFKDAEGCEKPMEVIGVKSYCWSSSVLVGDKIQQMEKRVEEMASGFKEPTEPQKVSEGNEKNTFVFHLYDFIFSVITITACLNKWIW